MSSASFGHLSLALTMPSPSLSRVSGGGGGGRIGSCGRILGEYASSTNPRAFGTPRPSPMPAPPPTPTDSVLPSRARRPPSACSDGLLSLTVGLSPNSSAATHSELVSRNPAPAP